MNKNRVLTNLPKKGKLVDWEKTSGMEIELLYEDEIYKVKIIESKGDKIYVDYNGYVYEHGSNKTNFSKGHFGKILGLINNKFKFSIGEQIKDKKRDLTIIDMERRNRERSGRSVEKEKWYKYKCNKCGWTEGWITESDLKRGNGCSCCSHSPKIIVPEINSIYAKAPWMMKWISEEDAKKYTVSSGRKITVTCHDCGHKKKMTISHIYRNKSISCTCGDGFSYPEKFITNLLTQLNIEFQNQLTKTVFEWCGKKRYDFYLPEYNMIIETHGEQHYEERSENSKFEGSLHKQQENDRIKRELALNNNIKHYIELDCRESNLEWIKNSVLNSEIGELFNLSNIDWLKCEEYAINSNKVREICDYWNNKEEWETTATIANNNEWGVKSSTTIVNYLKKGTKLGWCHYDPKERKRFTLIKNHKKSGKPVIVFKEGVLIGEYKSASYLSSISIKEFGVCFDASAISSVCRGERKHHKGFVFKYKQDNTTRYSFDNVKEVKEDEVKRQD